MTNDETARFWNEQAARFDDEADHGLRDPAVRETWRRLLRSVLPEPPADVADLGCGTGSLAVLLAEDGFNVTGIDLSDEMISRARQKASIASVTATFRVGDASSPEIVASSMNAVLARHVTWALPDPADALARWAALLREHGCLILVEGRWSTGVGIGSADLTELVRPIIADVEVRQLTDDALWGAAMEDERYMLVART